MKAMNSNKLFALLWTAVGSIGRLVPHIPNITPTLSTALFAGAQLPARLAIPAILALMLITDFALAFVHQTTVFGFWTFFTYTGLLGVLLLGRKLGKKIEAQRVLGFTISATLFFWIWTNLGVWLTSGMYELSLLGLKMCFIAAIPFLGFSLVGDLGFSLLLFLSFKAMEKWAATKQGATEGMLRYGASR